MLHALWLPEITIRQGQPSSHLATILITWDDFVTPKNQRKWTKHSVNF